MIKHYVQFDEPGSFFPESTTRKVSKRIPAELENIPEYTFALNFFDRSEIITKGETLKGKPKNDSIRILFGKKYTLEQLKEQGYSEKDALFRNIENSFPFAVYCLPGNWQPAEENDIVLGGYDELKLLTNVI